MATPTPAIALIAEQSILAQAFGSNGEDLLSAGTYTEAYVYPRPAMTTGEYFIECAYAKQDTGAGVEVGYKWWHDKTAPGYSPEWYTVRGDPLNKIYYRQGYSGASWAQGYGVGDYVELHLLNINGTDDYEIRIGGTTRYTWHDTGMQSSRAQMGMERTASHGYATYRYVKYKKWADKTWYFWPNASAADKDSAYRMYTDKLLTSLHMLYFSRQ